MAEGFEDMGEIPTAPGNGMFTDKGRPPMSGQVAGAESNKSDIFVDAGKQKDLGGKTRADRYRKQGIAMVDNENPADYKYGEGGFSDGVGTRVPVVNKKGGIEGSSNPYGKIIVGDRISGDESDGTQVIEPFAPTLLEEKLKKAEEKPKRKRRRIKQKQQENEEQIADLIEEPPVQEDSEVFVEEIVEETASASPAQNDPQVAPRKAQTVISFTGTFGKFRGKYSDILRQDPFVILRYDLEEASYTPPAGDEPFDITVDGETLKVCFYGVEFTLPDLNEGVQVMLLVEEVS